MEALQWEAGRFSPIVHFANRLACGSGESFGPRTIGDFQWIFVQSGKGTARIGNETFRAYPGCLFAYGPGVPHWFEASVEDPFVLFGLHFEFAGDLADEGKDVLGLIENVGWEDLRSYVPVSAPAIPGRLETGMWPSVFFEQLVEEFRGKKPMNDLILRGLLTQLIVKVLRWTKEERSSGSPLDRQIATVRLGLEERARRSYNAAWLAEWTPYSHDYVSRLFRARFGMAPQTFHDGARLAEARRLLEETELSSTAIADTMDFGSVHYFCKWFKLKTGFQPMTYRNGRRFI